MESVLSYGEDIKPPSPSQVSFVWQYRPYRTFFCQRHWQGSFPALVPRSAIACL